MPGGTANLAVLGGNLPPSFGPANARINGCVLGAVQAAGVSPAATGRWPVPPRFQLHCSGLTTLNSACYMIYSGLAAGVFRAHLEGSGVRRIRPDVRRMRPGVPRIRSGAPQKESGARRKHSVRSGIEPAVRRARPGVRRMEAGGCERQGCPRRKHGGASPVRLGLKIIEQLPPF